MNSAVTYREREASVYIQCGMTSSVPLSRHASRASYQLRRKKHPKSRARCWYLRCQVSLERSIMDRHAKDPTAELARSKGQRIVELEPSKLSAERQLLSDTSRTMKRHKWKVPPWPSTQLLNTPIRQECLISGKGDDGKDILG